MARGMYGWRRVVALVCGAVVVASAAFAQEAPIPALTARVTDGAGMLSPDQRAALESVLADYEAQKGTQIAVLTVSSTAPEAIEQYGIRVADAWKIGRKGPSDGIILIVAKDNTATLGRLRVEVGRGLEGAIPDAYAKRIIDETIAPHFRQGDFYGGLAAGVARIEGLLAGEALPPPAAPRPARASTGSGFNFWFLLLIFVLPIVLRAFGGRRVGYAGGGRALNGSFGSFAAGAILGGLSNRGGGFGGGGFGGGGGGGGGFSGGGGGFSGGGASGNW